MKIEITKGKDKGKKAEVLSYIKDSCAYRVLLENGIRTIVEVGEFVKCKKSL